MLDIPLTLIKINQLNDLNHKVLNFNQFMKK